MLICVKLIFSTRNPTGAKKIIPFFHSNPQPNQFTNEIYFFLFFKLAPATFESVEFFFCIRCQTLHGVPHGLYKKSAGKYITNRFLTLCGCGGNIDECESRRTEVFSTSNQWTLSMRWCTANTQWVQNHLRMFYFIVLIFHLYCR